MTNEQSIYTVEYRSRVTGQTFTKEYTGTRQDIENFTRDCSADLDCYVLSIAVK